MSRYEVKSEFKNSVIDKLLNTFSRVKPRYLLTL